MPRTQRKDLNKKLFFENIPVLFIPLIIIFLDQYSKAAALKLLKLGEPVNLISGFFRLNLTFNTGAAFGMLKNQTLFFIAVSFIASLVIVINILRSSSKKGNIILVFILAGAIGNLIDRLRFGYVIDFLDVRFFSVFNLADISITIGAVLFVINSLLIRENEKY